MKRRIWIYLGISFLAFLSGCVANNVLADAAAADNNVNRLSRIALRMNQEEVLAIMHAPYEKEVYRVGEDRYDIWFYVTTMTILGQSRMVPKNLTPLTFRNKQLVGVGYDYYHWVQKREPVRPRPVRLEEEPENKELEQELKKSLSPGGTTVPQKTQPAGPSQPSKQSPSLQKNQPTSSPIPPEQPQPAALQTPKPAQPVQPQPVQPAPPVQPQPQQPSNNPPPDAKLGPPPYVPPSKPKTQQSPPAKQSTMSKAPEKAPQTPPDPPEKPDAPKKPEWDEKDEEINEDAMDQDFNYW